jgi:hypothetical protein
VSRFKILAIPLTEGATEGYLSVMTHQFSWLGTGALVLVTNHSELANVFEFTPDHRLRLSGTDLLSASDDELPALVPPTSHNNVGYGVFRFWSPEHPLHPKIHARSFYIDLQAHPGQKGLQLRALVNASFGSEVIAVQNEDTPVVFLPIGRETPNAESDFLASLCTLEAIDLEKMQD